VPFASPINVDPGGCGGPDRAFGLLDGRLGGLGVQGVWVAGGLFHMPAGDRVRCWSVHAGPRPSWGTGAHHSGASTSGHRVW
jgi:hypothetical protein